VCGAEGRRHRARLTGAIRGSGGSGWRRPARRRQLQEALTSRAVIDQAKGILMAQKGVGAEEAFDILRTTSQSENRKLRDLARELVERTRGPDPSAVEPGASRSLSARAVVLVDDAPCDLEDGSLVAGGG
jgi:hypothetical protein